MEFTKNCVSLIYQHRRVFIKIKTGPKSKINAAIKLRMKRKVATLKTCGENVNSLKLIRECDIAVSRFTVGRYILEQGWPTHGPRATIWPAKDFSPAR